MEELASHGYVVISIEHAYDAVVSIFNNGDIADYRSGINYERKDEAGDLTPEEHKNIELETEQEQLENFDETVKDIPLGSGACGDAWLVQHKNSGNYFVSKQIA